MDFPLGDDFAAEFGVGQQAALVAVADTGRFFADNVFDVFGFAEVTCFGGFEFDGGFNGSFGLADFGGFAAASPVSSGSKSIVPNGRRKRICLRSKRDLNSRSLKAP